MKQEVKILLIEDSDGDILLITARLKLLSPQPIKQKLYENDQYCHCG